MSYVINRTWCLKQRWPQVNDHACFHLHWLHWAVWNGKGAKKIKIYVSSGIRIHARHSTTVGSALLTIQPRGFDDELWFNVLQDNGIQINKTITWQQVSNWLWSHVYWNWVWDEIYISYLNVDLASIITVYRTLLLLSSHNRFHTCIVYS